MGTVYKTTFVSKERKRAIELAAEHLESKDLHEGAIVLTRAGASSGDYTATLCWEVPSLAFVPMDVDAAAADIDSRHPKGT